MIELTKLWIKKKKKMTMNDFYELYKLGVLVQLPLSFYLMGGMFAYIYCVENDKNKPAYRIGVFILCLLMCLGSWISVISSVKGILRALITGRVLKKGKGLQNEK